MGPAHQSDLNAKLIATLVGIVWEVNIIGRSITRMKRGQFYDPRSEFIGRRSNGKVTNVSTRDLSIVTSQFYIQNVASQWKGASRKHVRCLPHCFKIHHIIAMLMETPITSRVALRSLCKYGPRSKYINIT